MTNVITSTEKTRVAQVAGGGFSGLTAAIALRQNGWDVVLHEKGPDLRAFGAGIYLWHNGLRVLEALGCLNEVLTGTFTPPVYETWMHNKSVSKESFNGLPWRIMTRGHLHDALANRARAVGVEIRTNSEAVGADAEGLLKLASGEVLEGDLIVGADGVGSNVRDSLEFEQERWGATDGIIRLIVPRHKDKLGHGEWDNTIDMWNHRPRVQRILYSPCNEQELYLGLMAPSADPKASQVPLDLDVWVEMFPFLEPCLEDAAKIKDARYDTYQTTKLDRWSKGKVVLVGDSAHAMCPALAQGAGCGMVNAYTMAQDVEKTASLGDALADWEQAVRPITDLTQKLSADHAANRTMSYGNGFTPEALTAACFDPIKRVASWPQ
ncbi:MAG: NAD(P)/FAD-dependent oxidoreductase [Pseudomonadota bacterium]